MSYPTRLLQLAAIAVIGTIGLAVVILTTSAFAEPGDNLPPVAAADATTTPQDTQVVIDVLANDSDPDGGTLQVAPGAIARAAIQASSPILFWECYPAGGGVVTDLSGNGNTGTIGAAVTPGDADGDCGGAHAFDFPADAAAVVSAEVPALPVGALPRSVLLRFQAEQSLAGGVGLFGMGTNATGNGQFSVSRDWANDQLIFSAWGNDIVVPLPAGSNLGDGLEHTLVVTYDGANTITAYLDGVAGAPATLFAPLNTVGTSVVLGQNLFGGIGAGDQIRQFAIFHGVLDASTIANLDAVIDAGALGQALTQPSNGSVVTDGATVTYTPNPGFIGTDTFTYSVTDGQGGSSSQVVTVQVTGVAGAQPDNVTVITGNTLTFNAAANDAIPDGVSASITSVSAPANGTASVLEDGVTIEYTPIAEFVGTDVFEYTLETTEGNVTVGVVTVTVTPSNTSPNAVDDLVTTPLGEAIHIEVIANDTDPEGQAVYISPGQLARGAILRQGPLLHWECLPEGGTSVLGDTSGNNRDGNVGSGVGFGAETGDCDNGTAMVFAGPDGVVTLDNPGLPTGQAARSALVRYKANTTTAPADIPLFGYGANGIPFSQFTVSRTILGNDKLIFTSWANDLHFDLPPGSNIADGNEHNIMFVYDGDVTVYAYYDGIPSGQGTLHTPLTTIDDTVMLGQSPWGWQSAGDEMRQFAIFPNAITEDDAYLVHASIEAAVLNQSHTVPRFGTVVEDPDHLGFTYTPNAGFTGTDQFLYSISDGNGGGDIALVTIEVTPGVAANNDSAATDADVAVVIDVLANDSAQPGAVLTIESVTEPAHGTAVIDSTTIVYTPDEGFLGDDTFQYTVSSDQGGDGTATVTVEVGGSGENNPPLALDDAAATDRDTAIEIDVLANDSDPDGDPLVIAAGDSAIPGIQAYSPILHWACLPTGATSLFDQSGNGRDGSVSAGVVAGPAAADCGGGTAMTFPDASASVSRATPGLPEGQAARSVMLRYRTDFAGPGDVGIFGMGTNGVGLGQFSIARTSGGNDRLVFASWGNDTVLQLPVGVNIGDGAEHTIVIVYDGNTTLTAYADGVAGAPSTIAPLATVDGEVVLGRTLYGAVSAGAEMRHFAVFDRALTGDEVAGLHQAIDDVSAGAGFSQPSNGVVTQTAGGLTYTPNAGFTGTDTFIYTVSDGNGGSDSATVTVTVTGDDFALEDDAVDADANVVTVIDVLANDTPSTGGTLTITAVTQGVFGTVTIDGGLTVSYEPIPGITGTDTFTYTATDGQGNSGTATVTVEVTHNNAAPIAVDDVAETDMGEPAVVSVLDNDSDPDGDPIWITAGSTAVGTLNALTPGLYWACLPETGSVVPDQSGNGLDGLIVGNVVAGDVAADCGGATPIFADGSALILNTSGAGLPAGNAARTVIVRVSSDLPDPSNVGVFGYGTNAQPLGQFSIARTSAGNDRLVFASWGNDNVLHLPAGSNIADGDEHTIAITYDGAGTITAWFDGVPGTPTTIANLDTVVSQVMLGQTLYGAVSAGAEMRHFAIYSGVLSAADIQGIHTAIEGSGSAAFTQGANGGVSLVGSNLVYTPNADFFGVDTFTYTITDGELTDSAIVTVTVNNTGLAAVDDSAHTQQGQAIVIPVLDNDGGQDLSVDSVTQGANGTVVTDGETVEYTPEPGFHGVDTFEVTITDGVETLTSVVSVTVNGAPVGDDIQVSTDTDTPVDIDVLSTVNDPEGTALTLDGVSTPTSGSVLVVGGVVTYTPNAGFIGQDTFTVTIDDVDGGSLTITVTVTVGQFLVEDDTAFTQQGQPVVIDVLGNDAGADLYVQSVVSTANGFTNTDGSTVTYSPSPAFWGTDTFEVLVSDGPDADPETWLTSTVTVTVNGAPVGNDIEVETDVDVPEVIDVLGGVSDPEEGSLTITGTTDPSNGSIALDGGEVTYTPSTGFTGTDSFTVTVEDQDGGILVLTVNVTVNGNNPPVAIDDAATAVSGVATSIDVLGNDSDPDGDALLLESAVSVLRSLTPDLYWACLPESGTVVPDQSGNGQDGIIQGNVVAGDAAGDCGGATPIFADGSALILNTTGTTLPSGSDARTLVVRFQTDLPDPSNVGLFGYGTNALGLGQFSIARTSAGNDRLVFASWGNDNVLHLPAGSNIADGDEHTIVVTYDGAGTLVAWFDGVAGAPTTIAPLDTQISQVMLGQTLYGAVSAGAEMRHFAIYSGVLDAAEIGAIHAAIEAGETLTFTQPSNGSVTRSGDSLVYTSTPGFVGEDTFTYVVSDGLGGTATGTVTVQVTPPPVSAEDDAAFTQQDAPVTVAVLDNDEGTGLVVDSVTTPANGTTSTDGVTVTYTPDAGFWGTDTFEVTVTDGALTSTSTVTVTVNGTPVGADIEVDTQPSTAAVVDVLAAVADPEGGALAIVSVDGVENGGTEVDGGQVTFTPDAGFTGSESFTVTVEDEAGAQVTITVTVNVRTPLEANDDTAFTQQGDPITIPVLDNDEGDEVSVDAVTQGENGTVTTDGETVTYVPEPGSWGTDTFTVTVTDEHGETATSTVTVTINGTPTGDDIEVLTQPSTPVVIDVLGGLTDPEGGALTIQGVGTPLGGTVTVDGGEVTYTPDAGFTGTDTFDVTVTDEDGGTLTITVTVLVRTPLVANDDTAFTQQDQPATVAVLDNDEGDGLEVTSVTDGSLGTVTTDGETVTYTPNAGAYGSDTFTVTVTDEHGETATSTVTVTVNGTPTGDDIEALTQPSTPVVIDVLGGLSDPEGGALTIQGVGTPAGGTVTVDGGEVTYTPDAGFTGTDTFDVTVTDEDGGTLTITVSVFVNALPVAGDIEASTGFEESVDVDVLGSVSDPDGDDVTVSDVTEPANGAVTVADGVVTYTPNDGFSGTDSFDVTVEDENGGTATFTVTIEVEPNTAPAGADIDASTQEETAVEVDVLGGFTDAEGDPMEIADVTSPANGSVVVDGGAVTYTPAEDFAGIDTFQVTVEDEHGFATTITVTVVVNGAPEGDDLSVTTSEDLSVDIDVLGGVTDPNGDDLELVMVTAPSNGSVTVVGSVVTYTPNAGYAGPDAFDVTIEDGNGGSLTLAVAVQVTGAPRLVLAQDACVALVARGGSATFLNEFWLEGPGAPSFLGITNQSPVGAIAPVGEFEAGTEIVLSIHVTNTGHAFSTGTGMNNPDNLVHAVLTPGEGDVIYTLGFEDQFNGGDLDFNDAVVDVLAVDCTIEAVDDTAETLQDAPVDVSVLDNDTTGYGSLEVTAVTQGANGSVTSDGTTLTYTPAEGYHGTDTFTYTVENGVGGSETARVTVTVNPLPVAEDDEAQVESSLPYTLNVLDNDDGLGGTLVVDSITQGANGTVTTDGASVSYTSNPGFEGTDTFTYSVSNGFGSATATVTVQVQPLSHVVLVANACLALVTDEASASYVNEFWLMAPGTPTSLGVTNWAPQGTEVGLGYYEAGTELVFGIKTNVGSHTWVTGPGTANPDGLQHARLTLLETPGLFRVAFEDLPGGGDLDYNDAVFDLVAVPCDLQALDDEVETTSGQATDIEVLANDSAPAGGATVVAVSTAANGTVTTDGTSVVYTPATDFDGTDSFTYTVEDVLGQTATATVTVTVEPGLSANDDFITSKKNQTVNIYPLENDEGEGTLRIVDVTDPEPHGSVSIKNNGTRLQFKPKNHFNGVVTFTYTVRDGSGQEATATVTVQVGEPNQAPEAEDDTATTTKNQHVYIDVLDNDDDDEDDDGLRIVSVSQPLPSQGEVDIVSDGRKVKFTPAHNFVGTATFTYTVEDEGNLTDTATVTVTVSNTSISSGKMTGGGQFRKDGYKANWGMELRCSSGSGHFNFHEDNIRLHVNNLVIDAMECSNNPGINNGRNFDTVSFSGHGTARVYDWWEVPVTIEATVVDGGGNKSNDWVSITVTTDSGYVLTQFSGSLTGGNHEAHNGN